MTPDGYCDACGATEVEVLDVIDLDYSPPGTDWICEPCAAKAEREGMDGDPYYNDTEER